MSVFFIVIHVPRTDLIFTFSIRNTCFFLLFFSQRSDINFIKLYQVSLRYRCRYIGDRRQYLFLYFSFYVNHMSIFFTIYVPVSEVSGPVLVSLLWFLINSKSVATREYIYYFFCIEQVQAGHKASKNHMWAIV